MACNKDVGQEERRFLAETMLADGALLGVLGLRKELTVE